MNEQILEGDSKMEKKMIRIGGTISQEEKLEWDRQMKADGFHSFWTWVMFVIRNYIRQKEKEIGASN